jgi:two-component system, OmpR family, response regulator
VVDSEADGEEGWFLGDTEVYGAAILDLGLPGMDGLATLKRWRAAGRNFPVLVLTARGTWSERVEGIDAGADDYLPKPFRMEELLARLRAIIRRSKGHSAPVITVGDTVLDSRQMRLTVRGVPVNLSPQEYRLVAYLMLNKGRVVSQQELSEHLQSAHFDRESNAVEVLIGRVRRKLPNALIETRRGFGYLVPDDLTVR